MAENHREASEWMAEEESLPLEGKDEWSAGPALQGGASLGEFLQTLWSRTRNPVFFIGESLIGGMLGGIAATLAGTPELSERSTMFGALVGGFLALGLTRARERRPDTALIGDVVQYPLLVGAMYVISSYSMPLLSYYHSVTTESVLGATGGVAVGEGINLAAALLARVTRRPGA